MWINLELVFQLEAKIWKLLFISQRHKTKWLYKILEGWAQKMILQRDWFPSAAQLKEKQQRIYVCDEFMFSLFSFSENPICFMKAQWYRSLLKCEGTGGQPERGEHIQHDPILSTRDCAHPPLRNGRGVCDAPLSLSSALILFLTVLEF